MPIVVAHTREAQSPEGKSQDPAGLPSDPERVALNFLAAMEARDIETAETFLDPEFRMTFPGTRPMTSIAELINWARDRYRLIKKTIMATEAFRAEDCAVIYVRGTLAGEWPDGTPFEGIRFIDRFEVKDGKLTSQDVWNDIAEERGR